MLWTKIKRVLRAGFINFWRNGFVSLSSILVVFVTLFSIGSVKILLATLETSLVQIKQKVDINVDLVQTASEDDIQVLKKSLEDLPEVKKVTYVSRDERLIQFKKQNENDQLILQSLQELGDNPLGAVLNIEAKDPSQYESIAKFLRSDSVLSKDDKSIVARDNFNRTEVAINRLVQIIDTVQKVGFSLSIILALISIIIAFNTIRLTIYISREEITIMKLVGASNRHIRWPFVVSGTLYGFFAALLVLVIFYPMTYWLSPYSVKLVGGFDVFAFYLQNFSQFFLIIFGSGVALGAFSSYLAVRRYLSV